MPVEPLRNNGGKVRIADNVWLVRGANRPVGVRVRVVAVEGAVVIVEPEK